MWAVRALRQPTVVTTLMLVTVSITRTVTFAMPLVYHCPALDWRHDRKFPRIFDDMLSFLAFQILVLTRPSE